MAFKQGSTLAYKSCLEEGEGEGEGEEEEEEEEDKGKGKDGEESSSPQFSLFCFLNLSSLLLL